MVTVIIVVIKVVVAICNVERMRQNVVRQLTYLPRRPRTSPIPAVGAENICDIISPSTIWGVSGNIVGARLDPSKPLHGRLLQRETRNTCEINYELHCALWVCSWLFNLGDGLKLDAIIWI